MTNFGQRAPDLLSGYKYDCMNHKSINVTKGKDLPLAGAVSDTSHLTDISPRLCAIVPDDYHGFEPKIDVKVGDNVLAGTPLLHDKRNESIKIVSPCAGIVKDIVRGERRHIERIVIEPDKADPTKSAILGIPDKDADSIIGWLMNSGLWAMMRQRPYDTVPDGNSAIRDIFVTGFDSAPLAVTPEINTKTAAAGVELLNYITTGKVYLSHRPDRVIDIKGAECIAVSGPHPAGNAGTIISAIAPINKGETVITLDIETLQRIGQLALTQRYDGMTAVAVCGSEISEPAMIKTIIGSDINSIVSGRIKNDGVHHRIISGNVLTGYRESADGFLRFPYRQITVIAEGDDRDEFMGWASLSTKKLSASRSVMSRMFPFSLLAPKTFSPDARLMGGRRALIMSGEYDRYMPIDILPEYLLKAIIARDIERMEALGIYEVAPEDFALGEWGDTSKTEAQKIVRQGLDWLRRELS